MMTHCANAQEAQEDLQTSKTIHVVTEHWPYDNRVSLLISLKSDHIKKKLYYNNLI